MESLRNPVLFNPVCNDRQARPKQFPYADPKVRRAIGSELDLRVSGFRVL